MGVLVLTIKFVHAAFLRLPRVGHRVRTRGGGARTKHKKYVKISTEINAYLEKHALDHPDKELVNFIINGVDIGCKGPQRSIVSDNLPSSVNNHDKVLEAIQAHIVKDRVAGLWAHPPFDNFVSSPLGAVPKKNSTKVGIIQDLSFPLTSGVNSGININDFSLTYIKKMILSKNVIPLIHHSI